MYKQDVIDYLNNKIEFNSFKNSIQSELALYKTGLEKKGSSIPIIYDGDREKINIGEKHIQRLCNDFANGIIDEYFIGYISDALLLSENTIFYNDEIRDKFELLSEFVTNGERDKIHMSHLLCN